MTILSDVLALAAVCAIGAKMPLADEANRRPDFAKFRSEVLAIVERKDIAALKVLLSPEFQHSFGAEPQTRDEFLRSVPWSPLGSSLRLGGGWQSGEFCFPYLETAWPTGCDAYAYVVIRGQDVALRKSASDHGAIVARLSEEIVERRGNGPTNGYDQIVASAGQGYVRTEELISPIGMRGCFRPKGASWELRSFIGGD